MKGTRRRWVLQITLAACMAVPAFATHAYEFPFDRPLNREMVTPLVDHGATATPGMRATIHPFISRRGCPAAVGQLLRCGAMLEAANGKDWTPLQIASEGPPGNELDEIMVRGYHRPKDPNRLDGFRDELIRQGRLKPGESFEAKYKHLLGSRKEHFNYVSMRYCYHERLAKEPVFKEHLKIRLYDRKGQLLAEDSLRLVRRANTGDVSIVVGYVPYYKAGHEIHIVRLKGTDEMLLKKLTVKPHSELTQIKGII